jgi:hypothetical protein
MEKGCLDVRSIAIPTVQATTDREFLERRQLTGLCYDELAGETPALPGSKRGFYYTAIGAKGGAVDR